MAHFSKTLLISQEELDWIQNELNQIKKDPFFDLYKDFHVNVDDSIKFEPAIFRDLDLDIKDYINDNLESELDKTETLKEFKNWKIIRNWHNIIQRYHKIYTKLGFVFNSFPNFNVRSYQTKSKKFRIAFYNEEDGYSTNPFVFAIFLQKFLKKFYPNRIIKFEYTPDVDNDDLDIVSSGYFEVSSEQIKVIRLKDLTEDDDFKIDNDDLLPLFTSNNASSELIYNINLLLFVLNDQRLQDRTLGFLKNEILNINDINNYASCMKFIEFNGKNLFDLTEKELNVEIGEVYITRKVRI